MVSIISKIKNLFFNLRTTRSSILKLYSNFFVLQVLFFYFFHL